MNLTEKLSTFFKKRKDVRVAYLFGSQARGEIGPLSDFDVAVLLDKKLSEKKRFNAQLEIISELGELLGTDNLDVVVLNDAPLQLKYSVIGDGIVLVSNEDERVRFEVRTMQDYLDMKYYFDLHTKKTISRVAEEGLA